MLYTRNTVKTRDHFKHISWLGYLNIANALTVVATSIALIIELSDVLEILRRVGRNSYFNYSTNKYKKMMVS